MIGADGVQRWISARGRTTFADGKPVIHLGVALEITERKQAEEALREGEERLRLLGDNLPNSIVYLYTHESDGTPRFLYVSAGVERLNGVKAEDVLRDEGCSIANFCPESCLHYLRLRRFRPATFLCLTAKCRCGCLMGSFAGCICVPALAACQTAGWCGTACKPTSPSTSKPEEGAALDTVQQERDRLSALINSIHDEIWFADTEKRFTLANRAALQEFGRDSTASIGVEDLARSLEVYRSDGSPRPIEEAAPLRALTGRVVTDEEEIIRTPVTGDLRYRQVSAAPVKDAAGNIIGSVSVVHDITERKQAESALQTTLQRFYAILSGMHAAVLLVTDEGRVEFANQAFCDRFGLEDAPADLVGLASGDMLSKIKDTYPHPDEALARIRNLVDRGQPVTGEEIAMRAGGHA